jgi:hypothetical protein
MARVAVLLRGFSPTAKRGWLSIRSFFSLASCSGANLFREKTLATYAGLLLLLILILVSLLWPDDGSSLSCSFIELRCIILSFELVSGVLVLAPRRVYLLAIIVLANTPADAPIGSLGCSSWGCGASIIELDTAVPVLFAVLSSFKLFPGLFMEQGLFGADSVLLPSRHTDPHSSSSGKGPRSFSSASSELKPPEHGEKIPQSSFVL